MKFLLFLILSLKAFSYMQVAPLVFDKRIDKGATEEFYITNPTNKEVGYRIYKEKSDNGLDMTPYMEFYPKSLKLKSGETKKLKVYIESPKESKKGEYTAILGIKEVNIPNAEKKDNGSLILSTDLKLELAGYVGDLNPKLKIDNLKYENNNLNFSIKNIGEIRTKIEVYLKINNSKELVYLDSFRLLKGASDKINKKISSKNISIVILDKDGKRVLEKDLEENNEKK